MWSRFKKIAFAVLGLAVFILALELLKTSARGLAPLFTALSVDSVLNTLGMGWLMAYIVLSGSPTHAHQHDLKRKVKPFEHPAKG